jgi:hypothetical protein
VLIGVERLSAFCSASDGRQPGLTPELEPLIGTRLFFTQLYASCTHPVRSLEALARSEPPTPGVSIVKRPRNEHLFSLAEVFHAKSDDSPFLDGDWGLRQHELADAPTPRP